MKNDSTQADICRIVRATMPLWEHLPQPMQDEMRIAIENYLSGVFDAGAGFYFFEVGNLWPQVQAALDNIKFDRCRCRIFREWTDMLGPLEGNEKRWSRFFIEVVGYAILREDEPDFSDDAELQELWEKTNVRKYDAITDKEGWVKVWKRKRRTEK